VEKQDFLAALITDSIAQDGHGMLPLVAVSRRDFMRVKIINLLVGLSVDGTMPAIGEVI